MAESKQEQCKKEIVKMINEMSGSRSQYDVFYDWIESCAIAIANATTLWQDKLWEDREKRYKQIQEQYPDENRFSDMLAYMTEALEYGLTDILGEIYMELDIANKRAGQFFTPFNVSEMCARMTLPELGENEIYRMHEPSCGSGGMIIAMAKVMLERGINYQRRLKVIAQDLDWKAVYMCYVQLSLLGINAVVVQGDTLTDPYHDGYPKNRTFRTPGEVGMLI